MTTLVELKNIEKSYGETPVLSKIDLSIDEGELVRVESRRGELIAHARIDSGLQRKEIFMPFCYVEAAANLLTNSALDPVGKIPEFKYCAVRVAAA